MIVAAVTVHWKGGLFVMSNGIEVPLLYATAAVALALTGFGHFALDTLLGLSPLWTPATAWIAVIAGFVAGVANLLVRRAPAPAVQ
jgi:hypothetical protein